MQAINESSFLTINNTSLYTIIRGKSISNPILLILHGGSAQSANFIWFNKDLEEYFTVIYFDQRGEGKSNVENTNRSDLTLKNYIEDIHQLTEYLKKRFFKKKIYLLGHSMGTLLGIKTIEKYPNDYISYLAIAQSADPIKNDNLAYKILLNDKRVNKKDLLNIPRVSTKNITTLNIKRRTKQMLTLAIKYGGMIFNANLFKTFKILLLPVLLFKPYNFRDKKNALTQHKERLIFFYQNTPMKSVKKIKTPIYFIHGKDDLIMNYHLTKEYYENLEAPYKQFITFEKSAHFPQFEEAKKFNNLISKLLVPKNEIRYD